MKVINITPYDLELLVFTSERSLKIYCNKHNYSINDESGNQVDLETCRGLALLFPDNTLMLYISKEYDSDVLDHELIHITWYISHIIGQPLYYNNNEFQAYLFTDLKNKIKKKVYGK